MKIAKIKKIIPVASLLLAAVLAFGGCGKTVSTDDDTRNTAETTSAAENAGETEYAENEFAIKSVNKYGNVILDVTPDEFMALGFDAGDIVTVTVEDRADDAPVGTAFSDVDAGETVVRIDTEDNQVMVAINHGSFAESAGIAQKNTIDEDPGYKWDMYIDSISITLKEKAGYIGEYTLRQLTRTNERNDYASLSDEEFANFRAVSTTGIRANYLYRSSSPINPALGRSGYAAAAMQKAGINCVLNLTDSESEMQAFEAYTDSYYSRISKLNAVMSMDFTSADFAERVHECILAIEYTDGPILIHCKEGKDRTGILCAIIECYMGASYKEVCDDYMLTYKNFYGVEEGSEQYATLLSSNLEKTLCAVFGTDSLKTADLKNEAKDFLLSTGLTENDLSLLKTKLG